MNVATNARESKRIMIADDATGSRDLLRSILEASNYVVAEAVDGEEVIERVGAFEPDLVILDLQMPLLDGYATAAALRRMPALRRVPIVALTPAATQTAPERISSAGFSAFLVKPIGPSRLRQCVASLLHSA